METINLHLYAWVVRGKQRTAILKAISRPKTPTQIRKNSLQFNGKISLNNTSDILRQFARKGIAVCLNAEAKVGRLYKLTDEGEKIRDVLFED